MQVGGVGNPGQVQGQSGGGSGGCKNCHKGGPSQQAAQSKSGQGQGGLKALASLLQGLGGGGKV